MSAKAICHAVAVTVLYGLTLSGCAPKVALDPNLPANAAGLELRAARGDSEAASALGFLYATGHGVPQDFAEAKKWYEFSSAHGNPAGDFNLGSAYQLGQGTAINLPEAIRYYHLAIDRNYAPAKFSLGVLYLTGKGVPRDETEATRLIGESANQGFAFGQLIYAVLYLEGAGVETNDGLAYEWASLAAARMPPNLANMANVAVRTRETAAKGLSSEELSTAQANTVAWKPGAPLPSPFVTSSGPRPPRLRSEGSGFVVGNHGEVATDFHVVGNCKLIKINDSKGSGTVEVHKIAGDRETDLAILSGGRSNGRLALRETPPVLGEAILTYGYPLGQMLGKGGNLTTGAVSGTTGFQGNSKAFQITAPLQPGSSGGPVVDENGAVLGQVQGGLNALAIASQAGSISQNVNFAWNVAGLEKLLNENGIAFEHTPKAHSKNTADLAGELSKATVKIECWR